MLVCPGWRRGVRVERIGTGSQTVVHVNLPCGSLSLSLMLGYGFLMVS